MVVENRARALGLGLLIAASLPAQRMQEVTDHALGARTPTRAVASLDLDGDDRAELVFGRDRERDGSAARHSVLSWTPNGLVDRTPASLLSFGDALLDLQTADLDGDGRLDLLGMTRGDTGPRLLWWRANGSTHLLDDPSYGPQFTDLEAFAATDLDGDEIAEWIVAADGALHVVDHKGVSRLVATLSEPVTRIAAVDLEGDGALGVALLGPTRVLYLPALHDTEVPPLVLGGAGATAFAVADFDRDGLDDLALLREGSNRVVYGAATGELSTTGFGGQQFPTESVSVLDADGDGRMDLVGTSNRGLRTWLRTDTGFWHRTSGVLPESTTPAQALASADVDRDGDLDLIVGADGGPDRLILSYRRQIELQALYGDSTRVRVLFHGLKGQESFVFAFASLDLAPQPIRLGPLGRLDLDLKSMIGLGLFQVRAGGSIAATWSLPSSGLDSLCFQALALDAVDGYRITAPLRIDTRSIWAASPDGASRSEELRIDNTNGPLRNELVTASVPFAEGERHDLTDLSVEGRPTAWTVLQRWPDRSIRVAQAQWPEQMQAGQLKTRTLREGQAALPSAFLPHADVSTSTGASLELEVIDGLGRASHAEVDLQCGEVLRDTAFERVTRQRVYHQPDADNPFGRDFLTSTFYVTERRVSPVLTVDWIVGNDYLGADDSEGRSDPNLQPLGSVDIDRVTLTAIGVAALRAVDSDRHDIEVDQSGFGLTVLRDTWIADGQTRRYRFHALLAPRWATGEATLAHLDALVARASAPLFAAASLETWQAAQAFGIQGKIADAPEGSANLIESEIGYWRDQASTGTWGAFGDTIYTGTSGTPRNAPVSPEAAHLLQSMHAPAFQRLEEMAWAQAHRPYHLYGLRVGARERLYLYDPIPMLPGQRDLSPESLGRRNLVNTSPHTALQTRVDRYSHGFNGYDVNHWTTDLLFDYWTLTGDAWAQEELRQLGESLMGMMRLEYFQLSNVSNARAEGWCMQGFVQAWLATGDDRLKDFALARIDEVIEPQRWSTGPAPVIREQKPDPRTGFGAGVTYFPPWEHGSVMLGFTAAHEFFDSDPALQIAEDVVQLIDYAWVSDYQAPGSDSVVEHAIRYWCPLRRDGAWIDADEFDTTQGAYLPSHPLGSVNRMLMAGLDRLLDVTDDTQVKGRASWQLGHLLTANAAGTGWDKWMTTVTR